MKIRELHCRIRTTDLREPYRISYESVEKCENVFLRIGTEKGYVGMGAAAPDLKVTGETAGDVLRCFESVVEPFLRGREVFDYSRIMERLMLELPANPSARAMVDIALFDLMAQQAGVPLFKLLGGFRRTISTSITIGIMPLPETLDRVRYYLGQGFRILKVKGGIKVEEDIEKVNRIRELAGRHVRIRFDANQGYNLEDSLRFIEGTRRAGLELLEQPTARDDLELLKQVTQRVPVLIMADESLLSLSDVFRITRNDCSDLINIKLMKTGGIMEAMNINSVARAAGVHAMVGCMDESELSIAAGLHFALSRPNIQYADLDGHLDLVDDPFRGMLKIKDGVIYPPLSSGLGWTVLGEAGF
jgi:L-alanine-DL-glutamate epimerase-like enolase superfamily enzyme